MHSISPPTLTSKTTDKHQECKTWSKKKKQIQLCVVSTLITANISRWNMFQVASSYWISCVMTS